MYTIVNLVSSNTLSTKCWNSSLRSPGIRTNEVLLYVADDDKMDCSELQSMLIKNDLVLNL